MSTIYNPALFFPGRFSFMPLGQEVDSVGEMGMGALSDGTDVLDSYFQAGPVPVENSGTGASSVFAIPFDSGRGDVIGGAGGGGGDDDGMEPDRNTLRRVKGWIKKWKDAIGEGRIDEALAGLNKPWDFAVTGIDPLEQAFGVDMARMLFSRIIPEGTTVMDDQTVVRLWAPHLKSATLIVVSREDLEPLPDDLDAEMQHWRELVPKHRLPLHRDLHGNYLIATEQLPHGSHYLFEVVASDGTTYRLSDPWSRFQPFDVFGPSEVVKPSAFEWGRQKHRFRTREQMRLSEIHLSTFSPDGTWKGLVSEEGRARLKRWIIDRGFNTVEIMPPSEVPGGANWGYDGTHPFAPESRLGTPDEMRAAVRMLHEMGLSVVLDVQLNHLGTEGVFHHLFNDRLSPVEVGPPGAKWGRGLDFAGLDGRGAEIPERRYIVEQNLDISDRVMQMWIDEYGVDGIRLDMTSYIGIPDPRVAHLQSYRDANANALHRLHDAAKAVDERAVLIAEDGRYGDAWKEVANTSGIELSWNFELMHVLLNMFRARSDRHVTVHDLFDTMTEGLVNFFESHDECGNYGGTRMAQLMSLPAYRMALGVIFAARGIPMVFQGWMRPFPFVRDMRERVDHPRYANIAEQTDHANAMLESALRMRLGDPLDEHPPTDALMAALNTFRRDHPALQSHAPDSIKRIYESVDTGFLALMREADDDAVIVGVNVSRHDYRAGKRLLQFPLPPGRWVPVLQTQDPRFGGHYPMAKKDLIDSSGDWSAVPFRIAPRSVAFFVRQDR